MLKQAIIYSLRIWFVGILVGNLAFAAFSGVELAGLATAFSVAGSIIPALLLVAIIYYLIKSRTEPNTAIALLLAFCGLATILPIIIIFWSFDQRMEWSVLVLAIPYIVGLCIGVLSGKGKLTYYPDADPKMDALVKQIGQ